MMTCATGAEDEDNLRFRVDCEAWFGMAVETIGNDKYQDTWDVREKRGYMSGIAGAVCTREMKVLPRMEFCLPSDIHIFGYTADANDIARADRLREAYPLMNVVTPLIERGVTKDACLALLEGVGIAPPRTYAMGFPNANCLRSGCCKAQSPNYWALHRKMFPEGFAKTAAIARKLGVRLAKIKGDRVFIDDIPEDWPTRDAIAPRCDLLCAITQNELEGRD